MPDGQLCAILMIIPLNMSGIFQLCSLPLELLVVTVVQVLLLQCFRFCALSTLHTDRWRNHVDPAMRVTHGGRPWYYIIWQ